MRFCETATLAEALDAAEGGMRRSSRIRAIYATPPSASCDSDEDSAPEDESDDTNLNHLGSGLLSAPAAIEVFEEDESGDEVEEPVAKRRKIENWSESTIFVPQFDCNFESNNDKNNDVDIDFENPIDYFEYFIDNTILSYIVKQTNKYAFEKHNKNLNVEVAEMQAFIGALMMSGYSKLPDKRMYWSSENDAPTLISNCFTRQRFEDILHCFHLGELSSSTDKLGKIRPLYSLLQRKFAEARRLPENICIDESMIPYFGNHHFKQFIRGKPIRFGFKVWCLCDEAGFLHAFDIYTGKDDSVSDEQKQFGLGGAVVKKLLSMAKDPDSKGHKLYIDNYFTSPKLADDLKSESIGVTGTVRTNRLKGLDLKHNENIRNASRGATFTFVQEGKCITVWKDNANVVILTNFEDVSTTTCTRWDSSQKKKVTIPQPKVIKSYNKFMGGVDLMDHSISKYRTKVRQRKWYWCIVQYLFDCAVNNAWVWFKSSKRSSTSLLQFRRSLALHYLKQSFRCRERKSTILRSPLMQNSGRYDRKDHWPVTIETQRRCQGCSNGRSKLICEKCNVGLHIWCFKTYHSQKH